MYGFHGAEGARGKEEKKRQGSFFQLVAITKAKKRIEDLDIEYFEAYALDKSAFCRKHM